MIVNNILKEALEYLNISEVDKWSGKVKTKRHSPPGLFVTGSASDIADWAAGAGDLQSAVDEIQFYINRAGSKLSAERKKVLNQAKKIVRGKFT